MRTNFAWFLVFAIGVSVLMWNLAGVDDALSGPSVTSDMQSGDELEKQRPDDIGINGSADASSGQGDIVGLIISGAQAVVHFIGVVVLLPLELRRIGFPWWFAYPLGVMLQIIASIGLIQFTTNRILR